MLAEIQARLDAVGTAYCIPPLEDAESYTALPDLVLTDAQRRAWTMYTNLVNDYNVIARKMCAPDADPNGEIANEGKRLNGLIEVMRPALEEEVRRMVGVAPGQVFVVRDDWVVCWKEAPQHPPFLGMTIIGSADLAALLGGRPRG